MTEFEQWLHNLPPGTNAYLAWVNEFYVKEILKMYTLRQSEMDRQDQLESHDEHQPWYLAQRQKYQALIDKAVSDMNEYEQQMLRRNAFRNKLVESLL